MRIYKPLIRWFLYSTIIGLLCIFYSVDDSWEKPEEPSKEYIMIIKAPHKWIFDGEVFMTKKEFIEKRRR